MVKNSFLIRVGNSCAVATKDCSPKEFNELIDSLIDSHSNTIPIDYDKTPSLKPNEISMASIEALLSSNGFEIVDLSESDSLICSCGMEVRMARGINVHL